MKIEEAMQLVAEKDGYSSFDKIPEHLELEYTKRAYNIIINNGNELKGGWINVESELPKQSKNVLVCTNQNKVGEMWFSETCGWHVLKDNAIVKYWMDMPLSPFTND